MARFIMDNLESIPYQLTDLNTGKKIDKVLPRYAVWGNKGHWSGKDEVLETSNDLTYLESKYGKLPMLTINDLKPRTTTATERLAGCTKC